MESPHFFGLHPTLGRPTCAVVANSIAFLTRENRVVLWSSLWDGMGLLGEQCKPCKGGWGFNLRGGGGGLGVNRAP